MLAKTIPIRFIHSALAAVLALLACLHGSLGSASQQGNISRSVEDYLPPSVSLVRADGRAVQFASLVDGSRPVVLEFFYTSCTTICGMQSATLSHAQAELGRNAVLVSISIDPEYDTPARLSAYASNFKPGPNWYMLTGRRADIMKILTAFDARPYGDNKMLHQPFIFIRPASGRQWVRLEGMVNSRQIVSEFRQALADPTPPSSTMTSLRESFNRLMGG